MNLLERESAVFFSTYKRIPLEVECGEGVYLYGKDGRRYLDLFGGLAVNALGHCHPRIIEAVERQIRRYIHASNFYLQDVQVELAERLVGATGYRRVFLCNSGTEAIEGALKIARRWCRNRNKSVLISFENAFHGRTMGALSAMDREKYRGGFGPLLPGFLSVPFNDPEALRHAVDENTAAVVLEFIQGEGGVVPATEELVAELKVLQGKFGFLVIADEIQTGLGRTGKLFAFQHYDIHPHIAAIAKSLGGGLPLGAILGSEEVAYVLEPGAHGSTFGGNPVACAAGTVLLDELLHRDLMEHVAEVGAFFAGQLMKLKKDFPLLITDVRGKGLMLGMQLTQPGDAIVDRMREGGVLINCTAETVLRFLPPLIISQAEIAEGVGKLREVLREFQI
jgi:predicted acetylornithine/succinylornithine family transaminase